VSGTTSHDLATDTTELQVLTPTRSSDCPVGSEGIKHSERRGFVSSTGALNHTSAWLPPQPGALRSHEPDGPLWMVGPAPGSARRPLRCQLLPAACEGLVSLRLESQWLHDWVALLQPGLTNGEFCEGKALNLPVLYLETCLSWAAGLTSEEQSPASHCPTQNLTCIHPQYCRAEGKPPAPSSSSSSSCLGAARPGSAPDRD